MAIAFLVLASASARAANRLEATPIHSEPNPSGAFLIVKIDKGTTQGVLPGSVYSVFSGARNAGELRITESDAGTATGIFTPIGKIQKLTGVVSLEAREETKPSIASPGSAQAAASSAQTDDEYKIAPGDTLAINMRPDNLLPESVKVRPDGTLNLPYIGDIQAKGETVFTLGDKMTAKLKEFVKSPWISVTVAETHTMRIRVFGAVSKPGEITLKRGFRFLDIAPEIGNFGDAADVERIRLIRADGSEQIVNLDDVLGKPNSDKNIELRNGDIVYVPSADELSKKLRVSMFGKILKQGVVYLPGEHATLLDAITESGGFIPDSDLRAVTVLRREKDKVAFFNVDIDKALKGEDFAGQNISLKENDVVYVASKSDRRRKEKKIYKANDILRDMSPTIGALVLLVKYL